MNYTDSFYALLGRVLPKWKDCFLAVEIPSDKGKNRYEIEGIHGKVVLKGDSCVSLAAALYQYLKTVMHVNLSWCGNRTVEIGEPVTKFPAIKKTIQQKYRVYMNYCTLSYTMAYWSFEDWEKEIDFMAMRGVNMPLAVIGTEYVMYETLLEYGFSEEEALKTVSAPAFQAWQWMTNLDSYQPIPTLNYLKLRLKLGQKIMNRYLELGMYPIQQGFSGHMPALFKDKFPDAKIALKGAWCDFPRTAQLDPLDPMFSKIGRDFLEIQKKYFGAHGFYACDPFHEGAPPRHDWFYLRNVGRAIDKLYREFDSASVWVMQSWSIRKTIARAVPKDRLLILDLDGAKCKPTRNFWGYPFVSGHLHNFGGKNGLHGDLKKLAANQYYKLKKCGANVVGTGLFPEGVEQNPVYYDLLFDILTEDRPVDLDCWLDDYVLRRYGKKDENARLAWEILLNSVYGRVLSPKKDYDEETGSVPCARPMPAPICASPCDRLGLRYDNKELKRVLTLFLDSAETIGKSDGYRFDVADFARQYLSNRVELRFRVFRELFEKKDAELIRAFRDEHLGMMKDLENIAAVRSETSLARWLGYAERFGDTEEEKRFSVRTAKLLLTIWGDADGDPTLEDYAWREWSGLINDYYLPRWEMFFEEALNLVRENKPWDSGKATFFGRPRMLTTDFGKRLYKLELDFVAEEKNYPETENADPVPLVKEILKKYSE